MIKLTIKDYSQEIPETIEELTLDHYINFAKCAEEFDACIFPDDQAYMFLKDVYEYPEDILRQANKADLSVFFTGYSSTLFDLTKIVEKFKPVLEGESDLEPPKKIRKGNQHFYLPEHLQYSTMGQWQDFQMYCGRVETEAEVIPYALAIFCQKKDEKYDCDLVEERVELFKSTKFVDSYEVHAFFLSGGQRYFSTISHFFHPTTKQDEQQQSQEKTNSTIDGEEWETLSNLVSLNQLSQEYTEKGN